MDEHASLPGSRLSALADGELDAQEFRLAMESMAKDETGTYTSWLSYHLIGDVLRSPDLARGTSDAEFLHRLQRRLDQEPQRPARQTATGIALKDRPLVVSQASNAPRWSASGLAAAVLMSVVCGAAGWGVWQHMDAQSLQAAARKPASDTPTYQVAGPDGETMLRNPELDALLSAHQQLGGFSAWQMPAGFLRNATFDRAAP